MLVTIGERGWGEQKGPVEKLKLNTSPMMRSPIPLTLFSGTQADEGILAF